MAWGPPMGMKVPYWRLRKWSNQCDENQISWSDGIVFGREQQQTDGHSPNRRNNRPDFDHHARRNRDEHYEFHRALMLLTATALGRWRIILVPFYNPQAQNGTFTNDTSVSTTDCVFGCFRTDPFSFTGLQIAGT